MLIRPFGVLRARVLLGVVVLAAAVIPAAAHGEEPPLDIPIPSQISFEGLLSTSDGEGVAHGIVPGAGACDSARRRGVSLPRDEAPHNGTYMEWWWWYGHLVTRDGRRFAFMVWFASRPKARIYWADYTITDLSRGTFHYGREPVISGMPQATRRGFKLRGDHASASGGGGRDRIEFEVDGYRLRISLRSLKPPAIQFGDGSGSAYCHSFNVYLRPRMSVTGELTRRGDRTRVTGVGDFARAWGFLPGVEIANTRYFTFNLRDGRDLFLFEAAARRGGAEATLHVASISDRNGNVRSLPRDQVEITPTGYWRRDDSCTYPTEYKIEVAGLELHARPALDQAEVRATRWPEMYALWPAWPVYWDGAMIVTGDARGKGWLDLGHGWCYL